MEFLAGTPPACIGNCPPNTTCVTVIMPVDPWTEEYRCECAPEPVEACCINQPSGPFCMDLRPSQCQPQGVPQGPGTACSANRIACCLPDGTCVDVDPLCCDELNGTPSPFAAVCLGDLDGDGVDDACEVPVVTQACCLPTGRCVEVTHDKCVALGGDPQGLNTICDLRVCNPIKWVQPPIYGPTIGATDISSTFEDALDGWEMELGAEVSWSGTDGAPPGALYARDLDAPGPQVRAPAEFLGDWSLLNGVGEIRLDTRCVNPDGSPITGTPRVTLFGLNGQASYTWTEVVSTQWKTYSAPLREESWQVNSGTWGGLLASVTKVVVTLDYTMGNDTNALDNVHVIGPALQPSCFWGWNELSHYQCCQIAADDWACTTQQPITDIH
jgi:hypothetical protein